MWRDSKDSKYIRDITKILEAVHSDFMITDHRGIVLEVSSNYKKIYNLQRDSVIGLSVYAMEKQKIFYPSVTAKVIESGRTTTIRQKDLNGREFVSTAVPVHDQDGKLQFVISFAQDFAEFLALQEEYSRLEEKVEAYEKEIRNLKRRDGDDFVIRSAQMMKLMDVIERVAVYDTNILITGETGAGKSLIAKKIHEISNRRDAPYVQVNCGAIPATLIESELFGYEKGAFTGAVNEGKKGLIEMAENGTLFLDEISELPLDLQVKLLQTIQYKEITKVGGVESKKINFRLITACNEDLAKMAARGTFREDLYYRLNVVNLRIPPLRERREDLEYMAISLLRKFNEKYGLDKKISKALFDFFLEYSWPGNIRELENTMERLVLASEGTYIKPSDLPADMLTTAGETSLRPGPKNLKQAMEAVEKAMVQKAYDETRTTTGVAKLLGISQSSAARKVEKYCSEK